MKFGSVASSELGQDWTAGHHLNTRPRVMVQHNRRTALPYRVSFAAAHEDYTEVARFRAEGDAHTYAQAVRGRLAATAGIEWKEVEFHSTGQ